jgi:hypothetical protein
LGLTEDEPRRLGVIQLAVLAAVLRAAAAARPDESEGDAVAWDGICRGGLDLASGRSRGVVGDVSDDEAFGSLARLL